MEPLLVELSLLMALELFLLLLELFLLLVLLLLVAGSAKLMLKLMLKKIVKGVAFTTPELPDMDTLFLLPNAKPPPREYAVKSQFRLLAQFLAKSVTQLLVKCVILLPPKSATLSPRTFPRLCALPMLRKDGSHLPSLSLRPCVFPSQSPTATQSRFRFPVKNRSVCLSPEKSATQSRSRFPV